MGFSGFRIAGHSGTQLKHRKVFSNRKIANSSVRKRDQLNDRFKLKKVVKPPLKLPKEKSIAKQFEVACVVLLISTILALALKVFL